MADYLVLEEDGVSRFTLEEGGGSLLLEEASVTPSPEPADPNPEIVLMAASNVAVYNGALTMLGQAAILSFFDANDAARVGAANYEDERDAVLRAHPWNFATVSQQLVLTTALGDWRYNYTYQLPTHPFCLRVLETDASEASQPGRRPTWVIEGRLVRADTPTLNIRYIARMIDPGQWDQLFLTAFKARLAAMVAYAVTGNSNLQDKFWNLYLQALKEARTIDGQESAAVQSTSRSLLDVR